MKSFEKQVFGHRRFGVNDLTWIGFVVFAGMLLVIEFQWNVVEQWIGFYLEQSNEQRPRIGTAWESFDRTAQAVGKVDTLVGEMQLRESELESMHDLADITAILSPRGGISVSKEEFLRLFQGLTPYLWEEWISVNDFMKMTQQPEWVRSYLWWDGGALDMFLVNQDNEVLYRRSIPGDWLEIAGLDGKRQPGILEETGEFQRRIYSADRLWQILDNLDKGVVEHLMTSPGLRSGESLRRIGLSSLVVGGLGVVGFEFSALDGGIEIERVVIRDDDLWELGVKLDRGLGGEKPSELY